MRFRNVCSVMFLVLVFCSAVSANENGHEGGPEENAVFRGLHWGDSLAALDEVIRVEHDELGVAAFIKRGDRLELGPVPLDSITYQFFNEELFRITLRFSHDHFDDILDLFLTRYGREKETNFLNTQYYWDPQGTGITLMWPVFDDSGEPYISKVVFESLSRGAALRQWQNEEILLQKERDATEKTGGAYDW